MKVLHILYSGLGGHGNEFFSAVDADTLGVFHYEALFNGVEEVRTEYITRCDNRGISWRYVNKRAGLHLGYYSKILRALRTTKPDVIRLHGSALILPAWLYKISANKKVRIISAETQANHLKSKLEIFWLGLALILADHVVFLTSLYRDQVKKSFRLVYKEAKSVVIPNGLDLSKFKPVDKQRDDVFILGMQSRIVKIKDYDTLLLSIELLTKHRPCVNVKLRIAGDGDNKASLEKLVARLGIQHLVEFAGMLDEEELISFIHSLDIYVHASFGETMSTAIMQAMACRLPILASNVDGISNMIQDGVTGLLVPVQHAGKLTSLILRLCDDKDLAAALAEKAYEYAKKNYSNKLMFKRYRKLYADDLVSK